MLTPYLSSRHHTSQSLLYDDVLEVVLWSCFDCGFWAGRMESRGTFWGRSQSGPVVWLHDQSRRCPFSTLGRTVDSLTLPSALSPPRGVLHCGDWL